MLLVFVSSTVGRATAQAPDRTARVWGGVAAGYGSGSSKCRTCRPGPAVMGKTASLSLGIGLSPRVQIGLQSDGWTQRGADMRERLGSMTAVTRYHPWPAHGWFVVSGAGVSTYVSRAPGYRGRGWDVIVGVGHDAVHRFGFSASPLLKLNYGVVGDLRVEGLSFLNGWSQRVVDAGVQVRWTLPRRAPESEQVAR